MSSRYGPPTFTGQSRDHPLLGKGRPPTLQGTRSATRKEAAVHKTSTKPIEVLAVFLALALGACGSGGVTGGVAGGVTGLDAGLPPPVVAGTWRGGDGYLGLVLELRQDSNSVTGSSEIFGRGRPATGGRVEGTITGSDLTFSASYGDATESEAGCTTKLEGTLKVVPVVGPPPNPYPPYTTYYPGGPPPVEPPFEKQRMYGRVSGNDCGEPFETTMSLVRD
jgi:hypothetical protein